MFILSYYWATNDEWKLGDFWATFCQFWHHDFRKIWSTLFGYREVDWITSLARCDEGTRWPLDGASFWVDFLMPFCFIYTFRTPTKLTRGNPHPNPNPNLVGGNKLCGCSRCINKMEYHQKLYQSQSQGIVSYRCRRRSLWTSVPSSLWNTSYKILINSDTHFYFYFRFRWSGVIMHNAFR